MRVPIVPLVLIRYLTVQPARSSVVWFASLALVVVVVVLVSIAMQRVLQKARKKTEVRQ